MSADKRKIGCSKCKHTFRCEKNIPLLFWPDEWESNKKDVTDVVKSFYEKNPFPNYEDLDSSQGLKEKAEKGIFARLLDEQIPHGAMILEVGCGTGQLSNFLGITWGRTIFATDICLNSLKLAHDFSEKNQIENVCFLQMNLFRPVFRQCSFDLVICNGVLHHTGDPFLGFRSISRLVKIGGFIIVGLYNKYGRIPSNIRRLIFKFSSNRFKYLDPRFKDKNLSDLRKLVWFRDQYKNPHESHHTIGEVLSWFDKSGIEFINSVPKSTAFEPFSSGEKLFRANPKGKRFDHFLVQLGMLLSGGREGGFFIMIGQKKA
ncbi:MAG: class I SAM-dependent methyltransferase [Candidatus Aminicenantaceae bacterium]